MNAQQTREGIFFALGAYFIWGIAPVYFKLLEHVPPNEILTHRIIWSFFFMLILLTVGRKWRQVSHACRNVKHLFLLALTAVLIGGNWLLYIWAVNNHHMLEASLGYFINPLVNVMLGMIFLGERFRRLQWLAVLLAVTGVLVQLWTFGSLPVIALGLAFSFALYGLLRKNWHRRANRHADRNTLATAGGGHLSVFIADTPSSHLTANPWSLNLLLLSAGIVTTVPLLFFTAAAMRLRLSTLGFFQYLGPTIMFILAVVFYGETFSSDKLITFAFIWGALALFILDALYTQRKLRRTPATTSQPQHGGK